MALFKNHSAQARFGIITGLVGALCLGALIVASIMRSTSSTAAIGFLFLPIPLALAFISFYAYGSCGKFAYDHFREKKEKTRIRHFLAALFFVAVSIFLISKLSVGIILMDTAKKIASTKRHRELDEIYRNSFFNENKYFLGLIAQSPYAPPELLDEIAHLPDSNLHEKMGSLFPIMGKNGKGLAVMRLVIKNPNASQSTIEFLASTSQSEYVLGDIASNTKTTAQTLRKLEEKRSYLIDWGLAGNRNTPPDLFRKLLKRGHHFTHRTTLQRLTRNSQVPDAIRSEAKKLLTQY